MTPSEDEIMRWWDAQMARLRFRVWLLTIAGLAIGYFFIAALLAGCAPSQWRM